MERLRSICDTQEFHNSVKVKVADGGGTAIVMLEMVEFRSTCS